MQWPYTFSIAAVRHGDHFHGQISRKREKKKALELQQLVVAVIITTLYHQHRVHAKDENIPVPSVHALITHTSHKEPKAQGRITRMDEEETLHRRCLRASRVKWQFISSRLADRSHGARDASSRSGHF